MNLLVLANFIINFLNNQYDNFIIVASMTFCYLKQYPIYKIGNSRESIIILMSL